MPTTPSGIPYFIFEAFVLNANVQILAPFFHKLPTDLVLGVVSPRNPRVEASFLRCFDSTDLTPNSVRAFAEHARIGIATGGHRVQIETRPKRVGRPRFHDVAGVEDVLIFGLDKDDTNLYLNQITQAKQFIKNYDPSVA